MSKIEFVQPKPRIEDWRVKLDGRTVGEPSLIPIDNTIAIRYYITMIKTFADKRTAAVFAGFQVKRLPSEIQDTARRKLKQIDAAASLESLRVPPGNRLELLKKDRAGQWSIRINDQWRVCFVWSDGDATDVEIADYH